MMKETKFINCEQYVLAKLFATETENESLKSQLDTYGKIISNLNERYDTLIRKLAAVRVTSNNEVFINFDSLWERYENEEFHQWMKLLELEYPKINTNTNEEEN